MSPFWSPLECTKLMEVECKSQNSFWNASCQAYFKLLRNRTRAIERHLAQLRESEEDSRTPTAPKSICIMYPSDVAPSCTIWIKLNLLESGQKTYFFCLSSHELSCPDCAKCKHIWRIFQALCTFCIHENILPVDFLVTDQWKVPRGCCRWPFFRVEDSLLGDPPNLASDLENRWNSRQVSCLGKARPLVFNGLLRNLN